MTIAINRNVRWTYRDRRPPTPSETVRWFRRAGKHFTRRFRVWSIRLEIRSWFLLGLFTSARAETANAKTARNVTAARVTRKYNVIVVVRSVPARRRWQGVVRDHAGRGQRGDLLQRRRGNAVRRRRLWRSGANTQRAQVKKKRADVLFYRGRYFFFFRSSGGE